MVLEPLIMLDEMPARKSVAADSAGLAGRLLADNIFKARHLWPSLFCCSDSMPINN